MLAALSKQMTSEDPDKMPDKMPSIEPPKTDQNLCKMFTINYNATRIMRRAHVFEDAEPRNLSQLLDYICRIAWQCSLRVLCESLYRDRDHHQHLQLYSELHGKMLRLGQEE
eukprot:gnl/MRDRNA2_/MRDRNA2_52107_c0_seq1.p1 gnl/MRDRNA2_/MRDRNA2_52107_c0~~gnl/MRDRNA2_/MRDRNA2_52107_c0_seq1.p1  ORF type:complete len:112 (+),score=11.89 gnl/MRDRNA2_/MRDRNA2_52107_c0_seq1:36-371(+)